MYTTDRLVLRPYRESDLEDLLRLWNDPLVQRGSTNNYNVPMSPKFKEKLSEWVDKALFYVIITLKSTGEFMGNCTINMGTSKNRDGMLGITIASAYWDKGYGTEALKFILDYAFKALALHRISLGVFEGNQRAVTVYKKLGFVDEGRTREGNWVDGAWQDVLHMGILEKEWAARYWTAQA